MNGRSVLRCGHPRATVRRPLLDHVAGVELVAMVVLATDYHNGTLLQRRGQLDDEPLTGVVGKIERRGLARLLDDGTHFCALGFVRLPVLQEVYCQIGRADDEL